MLPVGISQHPDDPNYGIVHWEDGSSTPGRMADVQAAYEEAQRQRRERMTAQNDVRQPGAQQIASDAMQAPTPQQSQAPQQSLGEQRLQAVTGDLSEVLTPQRVYVPGRPAVDPYRMRSEGVPVPVSRSVQTTETPFDQAAYEDVQGLERNAQLTQSAANLMDAQSQADIAEARRAEVQRIASERAVRQQRIEEDFARRQRTLESRAQELANREIDPNRYVDSLSTWQKIGLIAGSALMAAGSKQPITAADLIHDQIKNDIDAQRDSLLAQRGNVDNALNRMSQEQGSIESGRAALENLLLEASAKRIETMAVKAGVPVAQNNAMAAAQALRAKQAMNMAQLKQAAAGQTIVSTNEQVVQPRAAQPGYFREETSKERISRIKGDLDIRQTVADVAGKEVDTILKGDPNLNEDSRKELLAQSREYRTVIQPIENGLDQIDTLMNALGVRKNPKTGRYEAPNGIVGVGIADVNSSGIAGKEAREIAIANQAALRSFQLDKVSDAIGAARDDRQISDLANYLKGGATEAHLAASLGAARERILARQRNLDRGYDQRVVDLYHNHVLPGEIPGDKGRFGAIQPAMTVGTK